MDQQPPHNPYMLPGQVPGQPPAAPPAAPQQPYYPPQPPAAPPAAPPAGTQAPAAFQFQQPGQPPATPQQPAAFAHPGGVNPQAAALASQMFGGIQAAKASMDSNYEKAGQYLERIDAVRVDISRKQESFVAIEKTVIYVIDNADGRGHRVGEQVTHMLMQKHDPFLPNMKAFIAAACSMASEQITEANAMEVCGPSQPLTGTVVEVSNRQIQTRNNQPFTAINYKREVPPAELIQMLPPQDQELYFPNGALQVLAQHAAMQPQQ